MKRRKNMFPLAALLVVAIVAGICLADRHGHSAAETEQYVQADNEQAAAVFGGSGYAPGKTPGTRDDGKKQVRVNDIHDARLLALVNLTHPVPDGADDDFVVPAYHVVPLATADITLRSDALDAAKAMFDGARKAGFDGLFVSSGYRDAERQRQIYREAADKSFVQPPGHSEHQLGLAADILSVGVGQDAMAASPEGQWLAQNAWRYGFILRYPEDKESITGIGYEPWHFRYVGRPHAAYCFENGLCWEEYIQFLRDSGGYDLKLDGINYSVFYEKPRDGIINVPANGDYQVSSDNTGGYVITMYN